MLQLQLSLAASHGAAAAASTAAAAAKASAATSAAAAASSAAKRGRGAAPGAARSVSEPAPKRRASARNLPACMLEPKRAFKSTECPLHGTKYGTPHSRADCEETPASTGGRGTGTTSKGAGSEYFQPVGPYKFPKTGQTFAAANSGAPSSFSTKGRVALPQGRVALPQGEARPRPCARALAQDTLVSLTYGLLLVGFTSSRLGTTTSGWWVGS